jgi:hypothetical protein
MLCRNQLGESGCFPQRAAPAVQACVMCVRLAPSHIKDKGQRNSRAHAGPVVRGSRSALGLPRAESLVVLVLVLVSGAADSYMT